MFPELNEMLAQWRFEIDARAAAGERPELCSHADSLPVILYRDPARVSANLRELPEVARVRFDARPHQLVVKTGAVKLRERALLAPWEMKQFVEQGFFIQFASFRPAPDNQRGRRQLNLAEVQLREALALWVWALMPSLDYLARFIPGLSDRGVSPGLAQLAEHAPSLCRVAADSLKKRPDLSAPADAHSHIDQLHGLLPRLFDEGRRQRVSLRGGDGPAPALFGTPLQEQFLGRFQVAAGHWRDPSPARSWAAILTGIIDTLAKVNLAATALFRAEVASAKAFDEGISRLQGQGALATISDPEAGKRQRSAAEKVVRAARMPEFVQARSDGAEFSFEAKELTLIAFFSGVDPFVFCGQHVLLAEDILAVRDTGDWLLGRIDERSPRIKLTVQLKLWDPALRPPADEWEEQLMGIRDALAVAEQLVLP